MFRITRIAEDETSVTLRIEGRLVGGWLDDLARECEPYRARRCRVNLDLSGVSFADEQGVVALGSIGRGTVGKDVVGLLNCSLFPAALLSIARSGPDDGEPAST